MKAGEIPETCRYANQSEPGEARVAGTERGWRRQCAFFHEVIQYLVDDRLILNRSNYLGIAATLRIDRYIDIEHPLQALRLYALRVQVMSIYGRYAGFAGAKTGKYE